MSCYMSGSFLPQKHSICACGELYSAMHGEEGLAWVLKDKLPANDGSRSLCLKQRAATASNMPVEEHDSSNKKDIYSPILLYMRSGAGCR